MQERARAGGGADFGAAQPMAQLEAMNALAAALMQAQASAGSGDAAQAAQAVSQAVQAAQNAGAPLPAGLQQAAARLRAQAPAANAAQPKKLVVPAWVTDFVNCKVVRAYTPTRVQLYVARWLIAIAALWASCAAVQYRPLHVLECAGPCNRRPAERQCTR